MIKLNGVEWKVRFVSPFHFKLKRENDGNYAIACCDSESLTIYITEDISEIYLEKVLAHELTHAAMFSYGVALHPDQEELFADLIASYGKEIITVTNLLFARFRAKKNRGVLI